MRLEDMLPATICSNMKLQVISIKHPAENSCQSSSLFLGSSLARAAVVVLLLGVFSHSEMSK